MGKTELRKTGSFQAVDANGNEHTIHVYATFVQVSMLNEPTQWIEGTKTHKMSNGNHVNVHEDGTLEDIRTGLKMRRRP